METSLRGRSRAEGLLFLKKSIRNKNHCSCGPRACGLMPSMRCVCPVLTKPRTLYPKPSRCCKKRPSTKALYHKPYVNLKSCTKSKDESTGVQTQYPTAPFPSLPLTSWVARLNEGMDPHCCPHNRVVPIVFCIPSLPTFNPKP